MKKQMIIRIDKETKDKFSRIARIEGKTSSEKVRELVNTYIAENDLSSVVDELWSKISKKIKMKGFNKEDIDTAIKEVRTRK
ncbi:MAG: CopG family transcriptional regulator [Actinobacteria bacterium]|nr:CopG family transcriptional regulator [Actinomycetota bacterium]